MIKYLFPRAYQKYLSLPVLGSILNNFAKFLSSIGYPYHVIRSHVRETIIIDSRLIKRKCKSMKMITRVTLQSCAPAPGNSQDDIAAAATTKLLARYFDELGVFPKRKPISLTEKRLTDYRNFLQEVRGFSESTIHGHSLTISQFISRLNRGRKLSEVTSRDIENFLCDRSKKVSRGTMQHIAAHLRAFFRYLLSRGEISKRFDLQIDMPRVYREEKLPRSLDWKIVLSLLNSIDRSTSIGKRDYAMLSLITTYGLRASEIVALKLEDINWRKNYLKIFQRKTSAPLLLPLTNAVGKNILDYLRKGRPSVSFREVFVRHRAPAGILKPTALNEIFQYWTRRSGLKIPYQGTHCLRHSYAVHLLRQGVSLKTIGDILGHRSFESTCVYLRLNIEDLRSVPLSLPK